VAQRVIRVPHVAMVNLIAGRRIVPELIQHDFTASKVVEQLRPLLEDEGARATMQTELRAVEASLKVSGDGRIQTAIGRAARIALQLIPAAPQPRLQSAFVPSWPVE
jgi:lipid-A-disaccharide synthase